MICPRCNKRMPPPEDKGTFVRYECMDEKCGYWVEELKKEPEYPETSVDGIA